MAREALCAKLSKGLDITCAEITKGYYQQAVIMSDSSVLTKIITRGFDEATSEPRYNIQFTLKEGEKGFRYSGPKNGNSIFATVAKSTSDIGNPQYTHTVQVLFAGLSEADKAELAALDKSRVMIALQPLGTDLIEVYGGQFGMVTADYTLDFANTGGVMVLSFNSHENLLENGLGLIYKPTDGGSAVADFDKNFENTAP